MTGVQTCALPIYEDKITTKCDCGTKDNVSIDSALKQVFNGCPTCGDQVDFTFPNVKPSDKKAK